MTRRLRSVWLSLRDRALAAVGREVDYDYHTGEERLRRSAEKARDRPPEPPWVFFQGATIDWSGWRQGNGHGWLNRVWLPFWRSLDAEQRRAYLADWPPPDDDWRDGLSRM